MARASTAKIGKYEIRNRLSEGGMGRIYEGAIAFPLGQKKACAIKVMHDNIVDVPTLAMFTREALIGRELSRHPHIVATRDFGQSPDGQLFAVFDLEGPDLDEVCHELRGCYPLIRRIAEHVLLALRYLQRCGIVHCDISPGNILLGDDGNAKLADFGLARYEAQPAGRRGDSLNNGFIGVMPSPEARKGGNPTRQSDLYSLGAVLYELLAGHLSVDEGEATTVSPGAEQPRQPLPDDVPADLAELVRKLLQKRPTDRPTVDEALVIIRESGEPMATEDEIAELAAQWIDQVGATRGVRRAVTRVRLTEAARRHMARLEALEDEPEAALMDERARAPSSPEQPRAFRWRLCLAAAAAIALAIGVYGLHDRQAQQAPEVLAPVLGPTASNEASSPTRGEHSAISAQGEQPVEAEDEHGGQAKDKPSQLPRHTTASATQRQKPAHTRRHPHKRHAVAPVTVYAPRTRTDWDFFPAKESAE